MLTADHDTLHLEARYNYEGQRTGSLWLGHNFSVGKKVTLDATPMMGGVFGNLNGIAPGLEVTVSYKKLEFYSANEYIFDTDTKDGNFFYTWTQLTYTPVKWFTVGYVVQRTRAYTTPLEVQRGPLSVLISGNSRSPRRHSISAKRIPRQYSRSDTAFNSIGY